MIVHLCTAECRAMPTCDACGQTKKPAGRDASPQGSGYCDSDCAGYYQEPRSGHLWPGEECDHPTGVCLACAESGPPTTTPPSGVSR